MCFTNCGTREDLPLPMFNVDRRVWAPLFPLMDDIALLRLKHHIPLICTASKTVNKHKMNTPLTPLWLFCVQVRSVSFNNKHTTEGDGSTHSLLIKLEPQKEIEKKYLLYGGMYNIDLESEQNKYMVYYNTVQYCSTAILTKNIEFWSLLLKYITHAKKTHYYAALRITFCCCSPRRIQKVVFFKVKSEKVLLCFFAYKTQVTFGCWAVVWVQRRIHVQKLIHCW